MWLPWTSMAVISVIVQTLVALWPAERSIEKWKKPTGIWSGRRKRPWACAARAYLMVEIKKTFYRKLSEAKGFQFLLGPVIHGVGIMNSEMPYFMFPYQDKGYPEILETNMVVAVSNIGLYSGKGWGVRVEDTALVTENEPVKLTRFPKALVIK